MKINLNKIDPKLLEHGFKLKLPDRELLDQIDRNGYAIFENFFENDLILNLQHHFEKIYRNEGPLAGIEVSQTKGIRRLSDLVNKGNIFDKIYLNRILLSIVLYILKKPFKLSSLNGHDPLKGYGLQQLHPDWKDSFDGKNHVVNSLWMLDDFKISNGATRVIPKSHLIRESIDDVIKNKFDDNPNQIFIEGKAGDLLIYNAHLWHGSYLNKTGEKRRSIHCYFVSREHPQQTNQHQYLKEKTKEKLNPLAKYVLDVD